MSSLYMLPACIPLIRGANTEKNTYTRKDKIQNRKEGRRERDGGEIEGGGMERVGRDGKGREG